MTTEDIIYTFSILWLQQGTREPFVADFPARSVGGATPALATPLTRSQSLRLAFLYSAFGFCRACSTALRIPKIFHMKGNKIIYTM
jgi:hypothetical protein